MNNNGNTTDKYLSQLKENLKYLYYAKALSLLVKERLRFEADLLDAVLETQKEACKSKILGINILISKYVNYQFNLLKGKSSFDVVDALGALMVLDIKQAKNVLYHASVYSSVKRQLSFQTVLDDLMLIHNKKAVIPCLNKRTQNGSFELFFIDKEEIDKDLHDTHFIGHDYSPKYTLKHRTVTNYKKVGERLLRLFKCFDWSINKKDLEIFYITLTQISKEKTTPLEIDLVRDKINNIFRGNDTANHMFCVLVDLSRTYITSMVDLRDALSDYFVRGTRLSSSTLRNYLSDDTFIKGNRIKYEKKVKDLCRID